MRNQRRICENVIGVWLNDFELELVVSALGVVAAMADNLEARHSAEALVNKLLQVRNIQSAEELRKQYRDRDWKSKAELRDMEF